MIGEFSFAIFTPVFFVSMAIGADFIAGFDIWLVALVTAVAFLGKICGVFIGGRLAGMDSRQSLAVGCGLNARGILGIVMAAAAREAQLIDLRLFVACVLMCILTTMAAGGRQLSIHRRLIRRWCGAVPKDTRIVRHPACAPGGP